MATGEHAVQGMSEFVEKGLHFVDGKQRGSIGGRFGEVCHVVNDGAYFLTVLYIGFTEVVHPSSGTFPGTGEVIGIEYGQMFAVGIFHFECADIGVIDRHIFQFGDSDSV